MGWFYGFKLHIVINDKGEILNFCITQANVYNRESLKNESFLKAVFGKLYVDKGYISQKLIDLLFVAGIIAYNFLPNKPEIKFNTIKTDQLALFY